MWYGIASWVEEDEDGNDNDDYVFVRGKLYLCGTRKEKFQLYTGLNGESVAI